MRKIILKDIDNQRNSLVRKDAYYYKSKLIDYFLTLKGIDLIANEVQYGRFHKVCDLVVIKNNKLIGIEVKSELDNSKRLEEQLLELCKSFNYVIVFISPNLLSRALSLIPENVGVYSLIDGKVTILQKERIQKNEYIEMAYSVPCNRLYKIIKRNNSRDLDSYRKEIGEKYPETIISSLRDFLMDKYYSRFCLFLSERGKSTHPDDISLLSFREVIN